MARRSDSALGVDSWPEVVVGLAEIEHSGCRGSREPRHPLCSGYTAGAAAVGGRVFGCRRMGLFAAEYVASTG
ncbi:hypothetical protein ACFSEO_12150 [Agromyces cerinus subsp. nitratus]|uniref:hypothetical protein n=1 Tax=Agromyces cerinus TaxID=33878 RepID=UPI00363B7519